MLGRLPWPLKWDLATCDPALARGLARAALQRPIGDARVVNEADTRARGLVNSHTDIGVDINCIRDEGKRAVPESVGRGNILLRAVRKITIYGRYHDVAVGTPNRTHSNTRCSAGSILPVRGLKAVRPHAHLTISSTHHILCAPCSEISPRSTRSCACCRPWRGRLRGCTPRTAPGRRRRPRCSRSRTRGSAPSCQRCTRTKC